MRLFNRQYNFVQNTECEFFSLFPHRFDYLWAKHPDLGERPQWKTEVRYPLSDRAIEEGKYLYGVRFGKQTNYFMLDIDNKSPYHPGQNKQILSGILEPLEKIGIFEALRVTSSINDGIHIYVPFDQPQDSWMIALVVQTLLEQAGFKFKPGQLEIFPNPRQSSGTTPKSLYNGHRLPLQHGSWLLNADWQPIFVYKSIFAEHWKFAQRRNTLDSEAIQRVLTQAKRKRCTLPGSAQKFFEDLNTEVQIGWTGSGQTNRLLGRIAMQLYIFGSVITGNPAPLTGEALSTAIVNTARSLPGYEEFCQHQHEIERRARDWARDIEQDSRYYPYGKDKLLSSNVLCEESGLTWNEQQSAAARTRIQTAIAQLTEQGNLPNTVTGRITALKAFGINLGTLYNHRDLWHPEHSSQQAEFKPIAEVSKEPQPSQNQVFNPVHNKLLEQSSISQSLDSNVVGSFSNESESLVNSQMEEYLPTNSETEQFQITQTKQSLLKDNSSDLTRSTEKLREQEYQAKLKLWLESNDPILIAEARARLRPLKPPD